MKKEAMFINEMVQCVCGHSFDVDDFIDDIASDLNPSYNDSSEQTENFECVKCEREYKVTLEISVNISVYSHKVEEIKNHTDYYDKSNQLIPSSLFESLMIGDKTPLLYDGDYVYDDLLYQVRNGEVEFIFSNRENPNQINMFGLEI